MLEYLIDDRFIEEDDSVAVGVSGGADSMLLLWALIDKKRHMNFDLTVIQLFGNQAVNLVYVFNHEKCGDGAFFHIIKIDCSFSTPPVIIFGINLLFRKADGSAIAIDRFQIDRRKCGENVLCAIHTVSIVRNDDRAPIRNGVNGSFQEIAFTEKYAVEHNSAKENKE